MKRIAAPTARLVLLMAIALWVLVSLSPNPRPDPEPATSSPVGFSAERALVHVAAIAQKPHPILSAEHERVRDYVRDELSKLGLEPQIESGIGEDVRASIHTNGHVENIVARLAGSSSTRPLMLAAHYDSTRRGPGAGDDAHGVAVLLETLRALRTGPALRNDVIFLITDGEEAGLLGAHLFMQEHPWRNDPAVVLNFEARGTSGPSYMFETSAGNAWMIDALRATAPWAAAYSVSYEIYRRMPNDTDLTVFKHGGMAGMNFAFIGNPEFYHRPQDDVAHLDRRSLQEDGNYALGLARIFGNQDLTQTHSGNAIYFPTRLTSMLVYPEAWAMPIAWVAFAGLVVVTWVGRRSRGRWMAFVLAIVCALAVLVSRPAPGASYLLEWPAIAGIAGFAMVVTGPERIGWMRVAALAVLPAAVLLVIVPFASLLPVALGTRAAKPVVAGCVAIILACLTPQIAVVMRRQ